MEIGSDDINRALIEEDKAYVNAVYRIKEHFLKDFEMLHKADATEHLTGVKFCIEALDIEIAVALSNIKRLEKEIANG